MPGMTRRAVLERLAAAGAAAVALTSCGAAPSEPTPAPASPTDTPPAPAQAALPTASETPAAPAEQPVPTVAVVAPTEAPPATEAAPATGVAYLAVAHGASPAAITEAAIAAIGGIERFVQPGNDVVVKPNICNAYNGPEYASTTNPEVVATIVALAKGAGAKRVRVFDYPFGGRDVDAYDTSGIKAAVEAAGGEVEPMSQLKYVEVEFPPESVDIRHWVVYQDALDADVLINVPIAKHHGTTVLTLGAKNLMGLIENRGEIHWKWGQRIADLLALFRPALTVVDAVRILVANGPSGGDLGDVKEMNTVIASADPVAADAYATTFFDFADTDIVAYISNAAKMGLGRLDLDALDVRKIEA